MAVKLLNAVTTTGASPRWRGAKEHTIQVNFTGSPTAVTVDLEGSLDDNTYYQLASHSCSSSELSSGGAMFHVTSKYVEHIKANLTVLAGGSSPTVTVRYTNENS